MEEIYGDNQIRSIRERLEAFGHSNVFVWKECVVMEKEDLTLDKGFYFFTSKEYPAAHLIGKSYLEALENTKTFTVCV